MKLSHLLKRKKVFPSDIVFVTEKCELIVSEAPGTTCQQMGGVSVLVNSRWTAGPLFTQKNTTSLPVRVMFKLRLGSEEARKLSKNALSLEATEAP
jgi:hypothetical protein